MEEQVEEMEIAESKRKDLLLLPHVLPSFLRAPLVDILSTTAPRVRIGIFQPISA